jgi:hypothetical protein
VAGLYSGVEDLAFTSVADGFVFQTNNPWLLGPRRRYFVNDAQKAIISACIRETLRRLIPVVIVAAIVIPLVLIGGTLWLAFQGASLGVTATNAAGDTTSYIQAIDRDGSTVTLAGEAGAKFVAHVSGFPGKDATITTTWIDATGKAAAPTSNPFGPGGMKVAIVDGKHRTISSAFLKGRVGATPNAILLYATLLGLATFGPYFALMHVYSMRRLRPLLANLPRSYERVTLRDKSRSFASKVSFKLLVVMGIGSAAGCLANGIVIVNAMLEHRPIANQPAAWIAMAAGAVVTARIVYFMILRARLRRVASLSVTA